MPNAVTSKAKTGIEIPMLVDWDSAVVASYNRIGEGITIFPLGYLIDKKGVVRHVYTETEPSIETLKSQIDALLAEP